MKPRKCSFVRPRTPRRTRRRQASTQQRSGLHEESVLIIPTFTVGSSIESYHCCVLGSLEGYG